MALSLPKESIMEGLGIESPFDRLRVTFLLIFTYPNRSLVNFGAILFFEACS